MACATTRPSPAQETKEKRRWLPPPHALFSLLRRQKKAGGYLLSPVRSIIGVGGLDFRVRNGNGYCPSTMATGIICSDSGRIALRRDTPGAMRPLRVWKRYWSRFMERQYGQASRPISTARLCASPRLHLRPIDRIFSPGASGGCTPMDASPRGGLPA